MSSVGPIFPDDDTIPHGPVLLPDDVAQAVCALVARHTDAPRAAIYPLPIEHVVAIHAGERVTTEPAAVLHEHLCSLLQRSIEPSWLLVEVPTQQLAVLTVQQALAKL